MSKVAMFLPDEESLRQAQALISNFNFDIYEIKITNPKTVLAEAKRASEAGVSILVARGIQASLLKKYTKLPVVEIVLTGQEMALLVMRAKRITGKRHPRIGLIGFPNMFCDMSHFNELYDIDFRTYFMDSSDEIPGLMQQAVAERCDLVIGGDAAIAAAQQYGMETLYLSSTQESMERALQDVRHMVYAINVQQQSSARLDTLLDYSDNGILQIDSEGTIITSNVMAEQLLGKGGDAIKGQLLTDVIPEIRPDMLSTALSEKHDHSLQFERDGSHLFAVIAPIVVGDRTDGAFVTCHKLRQPAAAVPTAHTGTPKTAVSPVLTQFSDILQESEKMQSCIRTAKLYAYSEQPVVLRGEPGTERRMLAESIHNSSTRRSGGVFLDIPCDGLGDEEQWHLIFGEDGAAVKAHGGTLLLQDADMLTPANQYRLYQLIRFHVCYGPKNGNLRKLDVRVIITVETPLSQLVAEGRLRKDLFYLLSGLEIDIPPLRERREDLSKQLMISFRKSCERYSHYHILTEGAKEVLLRYPWPGNLFQIDSFMDRVVLVAQKRVFDESLILQHLQSLYPDEIMLIDASSPKAAYAQLQSSRGGGGNDAKYTILVDNDEAGRIREALQLFCGNRNKTAQALGISKVTLWRHMKKYGINV